MNDLPKDFYKILQIDSPDEVLREAEKLFLMMFPNDRFDDIRASAEAVISLYKGLYPGYKACSTYYHDFSHIRDTFLAMIRLIHGAWLDGETFSARAIYVGLTAALFHDSGYIQEQTDDIGTGAKFTKIHIPRSMDMFKNYGTNQGMSIEEIFEGRAMILCTDISIAIPTDNFLTKQGELLGRILTMADVLAQMADRVYLEKLLFLYHEFEEGEFGDYAGEEDLIRKTLGFFDFMMSYMEKTLNKTNYYLMLHFICRWGIDISLYDKAINNHRGYLQKILKLSDKELFDCLKRSGIVEKVRALYPRKPEPAKSVGGSDG